MALTRLGLISALLKQPIHAALREPGAWAPGLGGTFQSWRWVSGSAAASARARRVRTELAPRSPDAPVLEQVHEALEPAVSGQLDLPAIAQVLQHRALVVTRPVEWGTVLLGFEQANRYTVLDEAGQVVAHLMEEEGSIGRAIGRQLLRTRRPFTATVLSPDGGCMAEKGVPGSKLPPCLFFSKEIQGCGLHDGRRRVCAPFSAACWGGRAAMPWPGCRGPELPVLRALLPELVFTMTGGLACELGQSSTRCASHPRNSHRRLGSAVPHAPPLLLHQLLHVH